MQYAPSPPRARGERIADRAQNPRQCDGLALLLDQEWSTLHANRAKVRAAIRARNSNEVRRVWSFPDLPVKLPKRGSVISKRIVHWRGADDAALPKAAEHPAEGFEERVLETQAWRLWVRAHARRQVRTAAPQRSQQWRGALTRCYPPRAASP